MRSAVSEEPKNTDKILVIIPAHNEATMIGDVVHRVRALDLRRPVHVLVIDDGSQDATVTEANAAGAETVSLIEKLGYGCAVRTGYEYAVRNGFDVVVQLDGDGQHAPESVLDLLDAYWKGSCDVVVGSRFYDGSEYKTPPSRLAGIRFFSAMLRWLSGVRIADVTSGFQVVGPRALKLYLSDTFPSEYPDANMLLYLGLSGLKIQEVPARFLPSRTGKSMHGRWYRQLLYIYMVLFSMVIVYLARRIRVEEDQS